MSLAGDIFSISGAKLSKENAWRVSNSHGNFASWNFQVLRQYHPLSPSPLDHPATEVVRIALFLQFLCHLSHGR